MPQKILIIDDDPDILDMMSTLLTGEGYEVVLSDTSEILKDLLAIAPDLILLDVNMPKSPHNGDVLCDTLKGNLKTNKIPVILVSGECDLEIICSNCRADTFVAKPFDIEILSAKISSLLLL